MELMQHSKSMVNYSTRSVISHFSERKMLVMLQKIHHFQLPPRKASDEGQHKKCQTGGKVDQLFMKESEQTV